jgi:hypothetical protein
MKINGYDETSGSLLISFASDKTKSQNPEDYPSMAFQPQTMFPDVTDPAQIPEKLAAAGLWQAEQQAIKEAFFEDPTKVAAFKAMVGQNITLQVPSPGEVSTLTEVSV